MGSFWGVVIPANPLPDSGPWPIFSQRVGFLFEEKWGKSGTVGEKEDFL